MTDFVTDHELAAALAPAIGTANAAQAAAEAISAADRFEYRSIHWEVRGDLAAIHLVMSSAQTGDPLVQRRFARKDEALESQLERMESTIRERDRQTVQLRAAAPLRSKGRPVEDAAHLPLFVAGNEPGLFS